MTYWKQHCKRTCPNSEHCLKKHINDKKFTLIDIKYCFLTRKRVGIKENFKEFMNLYK